MTRRPHGTGSIRMRPSGNYEGRILLPGGKLYTHTAPTKRAVERALYDARVKAEKGSLPPDPNMKVADWLDRWLEETVKPHREPRTYEGYAQCCRNYLLPTLGKKKLARLSVDDVQGVINAMQARGLSPRTMQYTRGTLRRALNIAIRHGLLDRNVAALAETPTVRPHDTKPLTADDARAILAAVKGTRLECLVLVTLALGLRQAEVLGLTWDAVDLDKGELRIEKKLAKGGELRAPKTPKGRRLIPLPPPIVEALRNHHDLALANKRGLDDADGGAGIVFLSTRGTPIDGTNVTHRFQAALRSHGLPVIRFHDLRHASASFLCSFGVSLPVAMAILGHSQASTLLNVYAHANQSEMRKAMEEMGKLLGG